MAASTKGKGKSANPVKVGPLEQAAQHVEQAEQYARENLTPDLYAERDQHKPGTAAFKAAHAKVQSAERAVDSLRAQAVHSVIALKPEEMTPAHRSYVSQHGAILRAVQQRAESSSETLDQELTSLKERATQARKLSASMTAQLAIDAYRMVKVHKLFTAAALASAWGYSSRKRLDPFIHAGEAASVLGTSSPDNVQYLIREAKNHAGILRAGWTKPGANVQTVREHVRKAVAEKGPERDSRLASGQRTTEEAARGEVETPAVEAAKVGHRFAQLLVLINKGKPFTPIADGVIPQLSGDDVIRHVETAIAAYRGQQEQARHAAVSNKPRKPAAK